MELSAQLAARFETLQNRYPVKRSALIPMMMYAQDEYGYVSDEMIAEIARRLDLRTVAVEETLARDPRTGKFCVGDQVTVADLCLAAHLTRAKVLLGRDPSDYPNAGRIYATCMALDAFSSEHPLKQPDAPAHPTH